MVESFPLLFIRHLRAVVRLGAFLFWTLLLLPFQILSLPLSFAGVHAGVRLIPVFYHKGCLFILGIKVKRQGFPFVFRSAQGEKESLLFAVNHVSYLDIPILGSLISGGFVAKKEIARWPLFGLLAALQETVFIDRAAMSRAGAQRDRIHERLVRGGNVILFPEGTSSSGRGVLPFKSTLFASLFPLPAGPPPSPPPRPFRVQPVSLAYCRAGGRDLEEKGEAGGVLRDQVAWYGEAPFLPHIWRLMGMTDVEVVVTFHAPLSSAEFPSRKVLARQSWVAVAEGLEAGLAAGRAGGQAAGGAEKPAS